MNINELKDWITEHQYVPNGAYHDAKVVDVEDLLEFLDGKLPPDPDQLTLF